MNKCKWKDGKFEPCKNFNGIIYWRDFDNRKEYICSVCNEDIRKPGKEKPLIVKSGETWVAHSTGVDYLCIQPDEYIQGDPISGWKPFFEIALTDEIAKLRPMVIEGCIGERPRIIYGIDNGMGVFVDHARYRTRLHLATAKELQESEKEFVPEPIEDCEDPVEAV